MASTVVLTQPLLEGTTGFYSFELTDAADVPIDAVHTESLTLTVIDVATGAIVNGRDAQDALNAHNVTLVTVTDPTLVSTVTWAIQPADTVQLGHRREVEPHLAIFEWQWDSGAQRQAHKVQFGVEALRYVLAAL
jgi:hypothetical protein